MINPEGPSKLLIYVSIICSILVILLVLDGVFDLDYDSKPHRLNSEFHEKRTPVINQQVHENNQKKDSNIEGSMVETDSVGADSKSTIAQTSSEVTLNPEEYFEQLWSRYKEEILSQIPENTSRTDLVVRYYRHPADGNKVESLRDLRFYIHERPVDSTMLAYESNSIFYGDSISKMDLQLAAYRLIQAGVPIRKIELSRFHDDWKKRAIEIGADTTVNNAVVLTLEDLIHL